MTNTKLFAGFGLVGLVSAASIAANLSPRHPPEYRIVLEWTQSGWRASCSTGCNWERLFYECREGVACRAEITASGVRGLRPEN